MSDDPKSTRPTAVGTDHFRCEVVVANEMGLHARPASLLVGVASQYPCDVWIASGGRRVNGKSILQLLSLSAEAGTTLTIETKGGEAGRAIAELCALIRGGFGDAAPEDAPRSILDA
jgi:phosphotransferase system HPr (HPr) family protein